MRGADTDTVSAALASFSIVPLSFLSTLWKMENAKFDYDNLIMTTRHWHSYHCNGDSNMLSIIDRVIQLISSFYVTRICF